MVINISCMVEWWCCHQRQAGCDKVGYMRAAQAARQFHHSVAPSPLTLAVGPLGLNTIRAPSPVCLHPDHAKWAALRILFCRVK